MQVDVIFIELDPIDTEFQSLLVRRFLVSTSGPFDSRVKLLENEVHMSNLTR